MKKYTVGFKGYKSIFASSYDDAKKSVQKDLEMLHPNLNATFDYIKELEDNDGG